MSRLLTLSLLLCATTASAQDAVVEKTATATPTDLDLRLTLSSFLYRESGDDAPALADGGAPVETASPVKRSFGDLRIELTDDGLALDARIRQTASERFQSGATGGGEYELRTLAYRRGSERTRVTIGRQYIDSVGATKIDGVAAQRRLGASLDATLFAGAFPALGSRSLDTDYARIRQPDGSEGKHLVPVAGGIGLTYGTASYHGDLGAAAVYVPQAVPDATAEEASRVFTTASGYWRLGSAAEVYHFALLDVAGQAGVALTNGSVGATAHAGAAVQLSASINHVSTDALQIATRNQLADPDPAAVGIIENNVALIRVSQDAARAGASLALAHQRFEISVTGGVRRRPAVDVELADGSGSVAFPEARAVDATFGVLDRRSFGGSRVSVTGNLGTPLGTTALGATHSTSVRLAISRTVAHERGQVDLDITGARFRSTNAMGACTTSLDVFACYGASKTSAAEVGALASWRIGREWLLLADVRAGYRKTTSSTVDGMVAAPAVFGLTTFVRAQWRYH